MCKSKVFFVSFFAAIILGIGIGITTVSVQAARTKLPHTGMSLLVSNQKINLGADSLLDPEAIARIENGSLTLEKSMN